MAAARNAVLLDTLLLGAARPSLAEAVAAGQDSARLAELENAG
jgi:hypothetical protein